MKILRQCYIELTIFCLQYVTQLYSNDRVPTFFVGWMANIVESFHANIGHNQKLVSTEKSIRKPSRVHTNWFDIAFEWRRSGGQWVLSLTSAHFVILRAIGCQRSHFSVIPSRSHHKFHDVWRRRSITQEGNEGHEGQEASKESWPSTSCFNGECRYQES